MLLILLLLLFLVNSQLNSNTLFSFLQSENQFVSLTQLNHKSAVHSTTSHPLDCHCSTSTISFFVRQMIQINLNRLIRHFPFFFSILLLNFNFDHKTCLSFYGQQMSVFLDIKKVAKREDLGGFLGII